ncbi:MAG: transglycosylase domain-containing protein, partial [Chloroflexi bacterium]|nr:transglycosylase domain-containing protein [Chloroflexota bacterium]
MAMVAVLGGLVTIGVFGFLIYRTYAHDLLAPEDAIANSAIGTSIAYDRNGEYLYEYIDRLGGLRNPVPLEEMSQYMIDATVSTEDASFYGNPGINFKGLLRAASENLTPFGPGFFEGSGGSSITQQLVKNVYIEPEKRFDRRIERKVKETVIALELKRKYSDDQILEWYLNTIDYLNFAFGVEAAAQRYFGVSAKELTLAQAAMLAGIPQAPGLYSPVVPDNAERAKARQREVLNLMVKHSYITQAEADEAAAE